MMVMKHLLDTNLHVNNAQYVDIARELLPAGTEISEIRAEYRKAAVLGDEIVIRSAREGKSYLVSALQSGRRCVCKYRVERDVTGILLMVGRIMTVKIKREDAAERPGCCLHGT